MGGNVLACVMGDMDLVRPLGIAGVRCAVVCRPGAPPRFSRFTRAAIEWVDAWQEPDELVKRLLEFGETQERSPVLFYEEDRELLLVSRYRDRLRRAFRFVVAAPELVEDLVDKARFQLLAERLDLPVPRSRSFCPGKGPGPRDLDVPFPLILKPLTRRTDRWEQIGRSAKAIRVDSPARLRDLWHRLAGCGMDLLAQELVPGPETRIESYHCYVDEYGRIVAEFTGRKIRTYPAAYGHSTALEITDTPDVKCVGRELIRRLALTGVAKLDFKRRPNGHLCLLEVNPRFNLWHYPGALAGVNIPALVYADLTGQPRPSALRARPGVRWGQLWHDFRAARALGEPVLRWLRWVLACEAKSQVALDDPMPFLRGVLWRQLSQRCGTVTPAVEVSPVPDAEPVAGAPV